jgi:anti-sigma factor RsiW
VPPAAPHDALACADAHALLGAWVDNELSAEGSAEEALAVETHLRGCPACASEARALRQIKHLVRDAAARPAPLSLRTSLSAALAAEPAPERRRSRSGNVFLLLSRAQPRTVALGAAAAGVAAWFALGGLTRPILRQGSPGLVDDGVALHARTLPLDYAASDAGLVQRWLEGKLEFGVHLPRFGPGAMAQPALQGVRLSTLRARPAAMVAYTVPESAGRRVSLLIVDDPSGDPSGALPGAHRAVGGRDVFVSQARGYNVAAWRSGEIVYSLISDLDESDVLRLVAQANR